RAALDSVEFDRLVETVIATEPRRLRRGLGWYGAAAAVAAVVVTGVVVGLPDGSRQNLAFAEWSPGPQALTDVERAAIEAACAAATGWPDEPVTTVPEIGDAGTGTAEVPALALNPDFAGALIDRRG